MLTGNAICHRNPNWWIWCITTKNELRLHLNRPQWSSTQARARKHMTRARAQILISIVKSALLSRQTRSKTPIGKLVKWYQNWCTTSGEPAGRSIQLINLQYCRNKWPHEKKIRETHKFQISRQAINFYVGYINWGRVT